MEHFKAVLGREKATVSAGRGGAGEKVAQVDATRSGDRVLHPRKSQAATIPPSIFVGGDF